MPEDTIALSERLPSPLARPPPFRQAAPGAALLDYPLSRLANLSQRVEGCVGPDGDIVAFSILCPHNGSILNYGTVDRVLSCPGHYS